MELLSPCGNYETFLAVVNSGADAVYLAGSKYGARAYADNFSDEEILSAIKYAHLLNVKVYLTVNTLIKEKEWTDVVNYIMPFYNAGLDACIVQDIGLISSFKSLFPNMECHVSTQSFITSSYSVNYFKSLGVTRIVLARELSLSEVIKIKELYKSSGIEIETFIHGAMCYSYSGQCLFSSCLGGRSGNRGRCAGPCRLEYTGQSSKNIKEDGYLLSMKDQCVLEILPDLIDAGVDSLKIEGRMKRPEYAAFVTQMYRKYIDLYKNNPAKYKVSNEDLKLLKSFYMRSEIGTGYYYERNGRDMISINNPAYTKTSDELIEKVRKEMSTKKRTLPVSFYLNVTVGEPFSVSANYNDIYVYEEGNVVSESIKSPVTKEDIIKHFNKLGDTLFEVSSIDITQKGNCFIPVGEIKSLRRKTIEVLEKELLLRYCELYKKKPNLDYDLKKENFNSLNYNSIICVTSKDQLKAALKYADNSYIAIDFSLALKEINTINMLSNKCNLLINLPYVIRDNDVSCLLKFLNSTNNTNLGFLVNNLEEHMLLLERKEKRTIILGPGIYQWNKKSIEKLSKTYDSFIYPYELNHYEIKDLCSDGYYMVFGKLPLMQTANCVEKTISGCNKDKGNRIIYINDRKNYNLPVLRNCYNCSNTIYNAVPTSLHEEVFEGKIGSKIVISFVDETYEETVDILSLFIEHNELFVPSKYTKGYYKRGVE